MMFVIVYKFHLQVINELSSSYTKFVSSANTKCLDLPIV